jgi:hypothetical protein
MRGLDGGSADRNVRGYGEACTAFLPSAEESGIIWLRLAPEKSHEPRSTIGHTEVREMLNARLRRIV